MPMLTVFKKKVKQEIPDSVLTAGNSGMGLMIGGNRCLRVRKFTCKAPVNEPVKVAKLLKLRRLCQTPAVNGDCSGGTAQTLEAVDPNPRRRFG